MKERQDVFSSVLRTLLITKHLMFVDVPPKDEYFCRTMSALSDIVDDAADGNERQADSVGTILSLSSNPLLSALYEPHVTVVSMEGQNEPWAMDEKAHESSECAAGKEREIRERSILRRRLELFFDYMLAFIEAKCASASRHILDPRFFHGLSDDEVSCVVLY